IDYPEDRRQILVVSDASTDRTDQIVRSFADRGVELLRLDTRRGKTAAENAAFPHCRGSILVNTDATIRILPNALKPLVAAFSDPHVGVASGRDVSVGDLQTEGSQGESGYVGYEMWVRGLETAVGGIVGASGCFYGIRREIVDGAFPEMLSRDFASALLAREHATRAVSVNDAVCLVPRTRDLKSEYRRKVRTMARGLETLWFKRHLLNPVRHGSFAWMLWSHKLLRWLVFPSLILLPIGLTLLAIQAKVALVVVPLLVLGLLVGLAGLRWPEGRPMPVLVGIPSYLVASSLAAIQAWSRALRGQRNAVWEPTRRPLA
ncbi:MAG: glycosyltransferase, partial [Gemmatimonadota bacterium]